MFSREVVVTFGASVRNGVANNLIKVIVVEELVEEIFCCSNISKVFGWAKSK